MLKNIILSFLTSILLNLPAAMATELMTEVGGAWQHRNDVKIKPESGTYFEFNELDKGPFPHYRIELFQAFGKKSFIRLVYAPFTVKITGKPKFAINFNDKIFIPNRDLTINYSFNSYRATYIYRLWDNSKNYFEVGFTGKVRQADIQFTQDNTTSMYDNIGFVPLFYMGTQFMLASKLFFYSNFDFAVASQGQAFDLALKLRYTLFDPFNMGLGIRSLEGGADNEKVFTWSWFNYAVLDFSLQF
ncbi:MAG: hypothetical protein KDD58_08800 [Bdellovibrionales bacterium]|nr:hypothetical protein [Bdellovibrionales bacterium]